jgi:hypothetical protein
MRKLTLVVITLCVLGAYPLSSKAQTGFLNGMIVGSLLGSDIINGGGGTVLYTAPESVRNTVDFMMVRQASEHDCFSSGQKTGGRTLRQLFTDATQKRPVKDPIMLQIVRMIDPSSPQCAAIWFTYVEK